MDLWLSATESATRFSPLNPSNSNQDIFGRMATHPGSNVQRVQTIPGEEVLDDNESAQTQSKAKVSGRICACQATYVHCRCVPEEVIRNTYSAVQALSLQQKNTFISNMVFKQAVKRIGKKGPESRRKNLMLFHLNVGGKFLRVCKKMFCLSTGFSETWCNSYCRSASYRNDDECPVLDKCPNELCEVKIPKVKKKPETSSDSSSDSDSGSVSDDTSEDDDRDAANEEKGRTTVEEQQQTIRRMKQELMGITVANWLVNGNPGVSTSGEAILSPFVGTGDMPVAVTEQGMVQHGPVGHLESGPCFENSDELSGKQTKKSKHRKKKKKRRLHLEGLESVNQARKMAKLKRERGEAYFVKNYDPKKGKRVLKFVPARFLGERCHCKTKYTHCDCLTEGQRHSIFVHVWSLTWPEKKAFVAASVGKSEVDRTRVSSTRRHFTMYYTLNVEDKPLRVCKVMFISTTGLGPHFVDSHAGKGKGRDEFILDCCPNPICTIQARIDQKKAALEEQQAVAGSESESTPSESEKDDVEREWQSSDDNNREEEDEIVSSDHEVTDEDDLVPVGNRRVVKPKFLPACKSETPGTMKTADGNAGGSSEQERKLKSSQKVGSKGKRRKNEELDMMVWDEDGDGFNDVSDKEWSHDEEIAMDEGDSWEETTEGKDNVEFISETEGKNKTFTSTEVPNDQKAREIEENVEKCTEEVKSMNDGQDGALVSTSSNTTVGISEGKFGMFRAKSRRRRSYIPKKEPKCLGERCYCDISMRNTQCQFVTDEERREIFSEISLMGRDEKRAYILATVSRRNMTMATGMGSWLKKYGYHYTLKTVSGDKCYVVCWTMFSSTTGLTWYLVNRQMRGNLSPEDSPVDSRTKMKDKGVEARERKESLPGPHGISEDGLVRKLLCFGGESGDGTNQVTVKKLQTDCKLISEGERQRIFTEASSLNRPEKRELLSLLVSKGDQKNNTSLSEFQSTPVYHLRTEAGSLLKVCRKMFISATNIPESCIEAFLRDDLPGKGNSKNVDSNSSQGIHVGDDKRGDSAELHACDGCKDQSIVTRPVVGENSKGSNSTTVDTLVTNSRDILEQSQIPRDCKIVPPPHPDNSDDGDIGNQDLSDGEDWHSSSVVEEDHRSGSSTSNQQTPYSLTRSRRKRRTLARFEFVEDKPKTPTYKTKKFNDRHEFISEENLHPTLGHRCYCFGLNNKCTQIEEEDREDIFSSIRSMPVNDRKAYVSEMVLKRVKMRKNGEYGVCRHFFYLRVKERKVAVCREMFMSTTGISKNFISEHSSYMTAQGILSADDWKTGREVVALPGHPRYEDSTEPDNIDSQISVTFAEGNNVHEGTVDNIDDSVEPGDGISQEDSSQSQPKETTIPVSDKGHNSGAETSKRGRCRGKKRKKSFLSLEVKNSAAKRAKMASSLNRSSSAQVDMKESGDLVETYDEEMNSQEETAALRIAICSHSSTHPRSYLMCRLVTDEDRQRISSQMSGKNTKERQEFIKSMVRKQKSNRPSTKKSKCMGYLIYYHLPVGNTHLRVCSKMFHAATHFTFRMVLTNARLIDKRTKDSCSTVETETERANSPYSSEVEDLDHCELTLSCLQREAVVPLVVLTRKMLHQKRLKLSLTDRRELFAKKTLRVPVKPTTVHTNSFRTSNYKKRERGEAYWSRRYDKETNQIIVEEKPGRTMGDRCACKEAMSRCQELEDKDRRKIFAQVWTMTWAQKKEFVATMVRGYSIKSRKNVSSPKRRFFYKYFLPTEDGRVVRVCKTMFLSTTRLADNFAIRHGGKYTDGEKAEPTVWKRLSSMAESQEALFAVSHTGQNSNHVSYVNSNSNSQDIGSPFIEYDTTEDNYYYNQNNSFGFQQGQGSHCANLIAAPPATASGDSEESMAAEVKEEIVVSENENEYRNDRLSVEFNAPVQPFLQEEMTPTPPVVRDDVSPTMPNPSLHGSVDVKCEM